MDKPTAVFLAATIAVVVTGVTGWTLWMRPDFERPATWRGGESQPSTAVTLKDGAVAQLVDFPEGVTRLDSEGHPCLELTGNGYSGEAVWRPLNPYAIEVTFGASVVTISSGPAMMGSQDWSELRWRACGTEEIWTLWRRS